MTPEDLYTKEVPVAQTTDERLLSKMEELLNVSQQQQVINDQQQSNLPQEQRAEAIVDVAQTANAAEAPTFTDPNSPEALVNTDPLSTTQPTQPPADPVVETQVEA
jgi:hypothetical protein